jgi:hypothetical protein
MHLDILSCTADELCYMHVMLLLMMLNDDDDGDDDAAR